MNTNTHTPKTFEQIHNRIVTLRLHIERVELLAEKAHTQGKKYQAAQWTALNRLDYTTAEKKGILADKAFEKAKKYNEGIKKMYDEEFELLKLMTQRTSSKV